MFEVKSKLMKFINTLNKTIKLFLYNSKRCSGEKFSFFEFILNDC